MIIEIIILLVAFLISGIPLYIAVNLLGGKTSLLKTSIVLFLSGILFSAITNYFNYFGGLIAFILMIWLYREAFRLKWFKAFLAWLLQFVVLAIFIIIFILLGVPLLSML